MSSFGKIFKVRPSPTVTTFGESHGKSVGCIIEGVPSLMPLTESDLQPHLDRRRPGQNSLTTPRCEKDQVVIQSGTEGGKTLGTPICCVVENENVYRGELLGLKGVDVGGGKFLGKIFMGEGMLSVFVKNKRFNGFLIIF